MARKDDYLNERKWRKECELKADYVLKPIAHLTEGEGENSKFYLIMPFAQQSLATQAQLLCSVDTLKCCFLCAVADGWLCRTRCQENYKSRSRDR